VLYALLFLAGLRFGEAAGLPPACSPPLGDDRNGHGDSDVTQLA
jgi:hypothetical protein